jgi:hypothetical protein
MVVISELVGSAGIALNLRFRAAGVDNSASEYKRGGFYVLYSSSSVVGENNAAATFLDVGGPQTTMALGSITNIQNPNLAKTTSYQNSQSRQDAGSYWSGYHNVASAFDGFSLIVSSNSASGVVRVYGLSN